jgi:hypothetical protein
MDQVQPSIQPIHIHTSQPLAECDKRHSTVGHRFGLMLIGMTIGAAWGGYAAFWYLKQDTNRHLHSVP